MSGKFYEVEGAVFRKRRGRLMEIMSQKTGKFSAYKGDSLRVMEQSNPMSLDEVREYMDVEPVIEDDDSAAQKSGSQVRVSGYVNKRGAVMESHYRRAAKFAAAKHEGQFRKDGKTKYIAHPVTVADILAREGGVTDEATLIAALLHDTIEDTGTTHAELVREFGRDVADTVQAVTNDETLPKADQKRAQIDKAAKYPTRAAHLKMADKIANLRDILKIPPKGWDTARKLAYYDHAKAVVDAMPDPHPALKRAFDYTYQKGVDQLLAMIGETGGERND